jgi:hypothetical protein
VIVNFYILLFPEKSLKRNYPRMVPSSEVPLPKGLDPIKRKSLVESFKKKYNRRDTKGLYEWLSQGKDRNSDYEHFKETVSPNYEFGKIKSTSFYSHEFIETRRGFSYFDLFYLTEFSNESGWITLRIKDKGDRFDVVGFNMSSKESSF